MRSLKTLILMLVSAAAFAQPATNYVQPMGYTYYSFPYYINIGNGIVKKTEQTAYLEIGPSSGANRGLLMPRLSTTERNAISSPPAGLVIYNKTTSRINYYSGSAWIDPGTGDGWGLDGNAGTNPSIKFIGTADNQPLVFRVNNIRAGRITPKNSYVSIDSLEDVAVYWGLGAGNRDTTADFYANIGIGRNALASWFGSANQNIAMGHMTLSHLISGTGGGSNVAIGYKSGMDMINGFRNTYMGIHSGLRTTTAQKNTFNGAMAGELNTTGSFNEAFGQGALRTCTGCTVNTAIGTQALYSATGSVLSVTITSSVGTWTTGTATFSAPVHYGTGFDPTVQATGTLVIAGGAVTGVTITEPGIGYQAGATVTITGDGTSATGTVNIVYGSFNVGLGADVAFFNRAGWYNTSIGYRAGYVSGRYYDSSNTFIGKMATIDGTAGVGHIDHVTVIGADATGFQKNSIILGRPTAVAQDRVGIGTFAPNNRLHVNGRVQIDSGLLFTAVTNNGLGGGFGQSFISAPSLNANGYFNLIYGKNNSTGSNAAFGLQFDNDASHSLIFNIEGSNRTGNGAADGGVIGNVGGAGGLKMLTTAAGSTIKFGFTVGSANQYIFFKDSAYIPLQTATEAADTAWKVTWNSITHKLSYAPNVPGSGGGGGGSYSFSSPLNESGGTVTIANAAADGSTKGAASFVANDFDASSGNVGIDYTNGQAASGSNKGFLTSTDWTTFNNKVGTSRTISVGFGLTGGGDLSANRIVSADTAVGVGVFAWPRWLKERDSLNAALDAKYVSSSLHFYYHNVNKSGYLPTGKLDNDSTQKQYAWKVITGNAGVTATHDIEAGDSTETVTFSGLASLTGTETFTNKTLTAPKFINGGFIADANGNEQIIFTTTPSAVNEITVENSATGNGPNIVASGGDTNIDLNFFTKATGTFNFRGSAAVAGTTKWYEDVDDGSNYTSIKVGTQSGNIGYTWPTTAPASDGYILSSTTAGVWSWINRYDFGNNAVSGNSNAYNDQTGTSYTLVSGDNGKIVTLSNASAITLTVPASLPAGFNCTIIQKGAGQVTITPSSTTVNNRQSFTKTKGQYSMVTLVQYTTNTFISQGDME